MIRAQMDSVISETAEITETKKHFNIKLYQLKQIKKAQNQFLTKETSVIKDLKNDQNDLAKDY